MQNSIVLDKVVKTRPSMVFEVRNEEKSPQKSDTKHEKQWGVVKITINRLGYKSHITSISRRAPNRYFISLAETVARRTWKINTKKEGQLSCKLCVQLGAAFVRVGEGWVR